MMWRQFMAVAAASMVGIGSVSAQTLPAVIPPEVLLSCHRSPIATGRLQRMGYDQAVNLDGGFQAWNAPSLSVRR